MLVSILTFCRELKIPKSEGDLLELGQDLSDVERKEYAELVRFLRDKWTIKPK